MSSTLQDPPTGHPMRPPVSLGGPSRTFGVLSPILAILATLLSAWPLSDLFEAPLWLGPGVLMMLSVGATGMFARAVTSRRLLVISSQLLVLVILAVLLFAASTAVLGIVPTGATFGRFAALFGDAAQTIQTSPPPAPASSGVVALLAVALATVALLSDVIAVTFRRPALAGLVLLMPLLIAVANSDGSLSMVFFVATAACWLGLLAVQDRAELRSWLPRGAHAGDVERTSLSLALGAAGIVLALVAAAALPHAPARYLADGLGRDGGGRGAVGYSPSADLLRDLENSDPSPVLTYRTDDPDPPPLRVSVAEFYSEGRWYPLNSRRATGGTPELPYPAVDGGIEQTQRTTQVEETRLKAPYLATTGRLTRMSVTGADWAQTPSSDVVSVDQTPARYSMTYLDVEPKPSQLQSGSPRIGQDTASSEAPSSYVTETTERVTSGQASEFDKAVAIQNWLRSEAFTYSLQLAPRPAGMGDQEAALTAVDRFLQTKRGYCVQFATAMVLMARSQGMRARVVTGFLPGTRKGDNRDVVASDAHMWPEIYFQGAGWVRFEPTPGSRTGSPPGYSLPAAPGAGGTATASPTPSASEREPTAAPSVGSSQQRPELGDTGGVEAGAVDSPNYVGWALTLGVLLAVVALGALVLPVAARRRQRRELTVAANGESVADAIETRWRHLLEEVSDLGIAEDASGTLAQQHRQLTLHTLLDPEHDAALGRVTDAVQSARYTRDPVVDLVSLDADLAVVRRALRASRRRRDRIVASLWPTAGRRAIREWVAKVREHQPSEGPRRRSADGPDASLNSSHLTSAGQPGTSGERPKDHSLFTRPSGDA